MVCIEGNFQFFPQNFLFEQEVAKHLEEIAKTEGKTQTQIAQEAIEEKYEQISIKKKLETLDEIRDSFHGLLTDVDAKASAIEHAEALELCADSTLDFRDYEDALQYVCARKIEADLIVTNDKGFVFKDIALLDTRN